MFLLKIKEKVEIAFRLLLNNLVQNLCLYYKISKFIIKSSPQFSIFVIPIIHYR